MAVPLSTYFMALILAIGACFRGETKGGCRLPRPASPPWSCKAQGINLTATNKHWFYVSADKCAGALYMS